MPECCGGGETAGLVDPVVVSNTPRMASKAEESNSPVGVAPVAAAKDPMGAPTRGGGGKPETDVAGKTGPVDWKVALPGGLTGGGGGIALDALGVGPPEDACGCF